MIPYSDGHPARAYRISWNKTASQADHAGQPPSSFLFLHQGRARPAQGAGRMTAFGQVLGL